MKKATIAPFVWWGLTALWMVVIFLFSARTASVSNGDSHSIITYLASLFIPDFAAWSESEKLALMDAWNVLVRKVGHLAEYAVLGGLLTASWYSCRFTAFRAFSLATVTSCLYAMTDELHQYFVPGRAAALFDVCLDTVGGMLGGLFVWFLLYRAAKRKLQKNSE